jgi:hypothetical protein
VSDQPDLFLFTPEKQNATADVTFVDIGRLFRFHICTDERRAM